MNLNLDNTSTDSTQHTDESFDHVTFDTKRTRSFGIMVAASGNDGTRNRTMACARYGWSSHINYNPGPSKLSQS